MNRQDAHDLLDAARDGVPFATTTIAKALARTGDTGKVQRGVATTKHLRLRSWIDPHDRNPYDPCWHWLGASTEDGNPRIWTFCHDRCEKRVMPPAKAVWNISRQAGTGNKLAYRTCFVTDCVNPSHVALATSKAEIGALLSASGVRKGTSIEARRAAGAKGREVRGIVDTPAAVVLACRAAPKSVTNIALAAEHGITHQAVSKIRRNETRRGVVLA